MGIILTKNRYMFKSFVDSFSKILFTIIPIVMGFKDILLFKNQPEKQVIVTIFDDATRVSFMISVLSLMFFYLLEYTKEKPLRLKIETLFSLVFLAVSFILTIIPLTVTTSETSFLLIDFISLISFLAAVFSIVFEGLITFILYDCGVESYFQNRLHRASSITSDAGCFISANVY